MKDLTDILFVHKGKEAYPEIAAYRAFFAGRYAFREIRPRQLAAFGDLSRTIVWHMMGFCPRRAAGAGLVVHDYRSLSIGFLPKLKDRIKQHFNARPDIRIFQNEAMQQALGLRSDGAATVFLPMGVPPEILDICAAPRPKDGPDFCYIGVMSAERRTALMLSSFLRRFGGTKTFHLYGAPEDSLVENYRAHSNIVFCGRLPQRDVFTRLRGARVAVNYFPLHHPHLLQTPTKLLEYAALGLRVLSSEHPQSRLAALQYGIQTRWGAAADMFADVPDDLDWPTNEGLDPSAFLWPGVIARSGIAALLEKMERRT